MKSYILLATDDCGDTTAIATFPSQARVNEVKILMNAYAKTNPVLVNDEDASDVSVLKFAEGWPIPSLGGFSYYNTATIAVMQ